MPVSKPAGRQTKGGNRHWPPPQFTRNFRFGLLTRTLHAFPAIGTTNLPPEQATERSSRTSIRSGLDSGPLETTCSFRDSGTNSRPCDSGHSQNSILVVHEQEHREGGAVMVLPKDIELKSQIPGKLLDQHWYKFFSVRSGVNKVTNRVRIVPKMKRRQCTESLAQRSI